MTLQDLKSEWEDNEQFHSTIHQFFTDQVNANDQLREHRDFVENNVFGMGEKSFWWLWKLICDELPENPKLLEIGVFKAATLSLWKLLRPDATCFGVTPLDGRGTGWTEDDYEAHIKHIHDLFKLEQPELIIGSSTDEKCIAEAKHQSPYDVVYVDGDHSYTGALADLNNYAPMVKSGGFLVIDDCNCNFSMPFGYFTGIDTVTEAKLDWLKENGNDWEFFGSVVHISVFKRK